MSLTEWWLGVTSRSKSGIVTSLKPGNFNCQNFTTMTLRSMSFNVNMKATLHCFIRLLRYRQYHTLYLIGLNFYKSIIPQWIDDCRRNKKVSWYEACYQLPITIRTSNDSTGPRARHKVVRRRWTRGMISLARAWGLGTGWLIYLPTGHSPTHSRSRWDNITRPRSDNWSDWPASGQLIFIFNDIWVLVRQAPPLLTGLMYAPLQTHNYHSLLEPPHNKPETPHQF